MLEKRKENKDYLDSNSSLIQFLDCQTDEYIEVFIKSKYKKGQYVDQSTAMSHGRSRALIEHDRVNIIRSFRSTQIFIGNVKIWDNQIKSGFQGKSKLAKIVP